ncbi:MAG: MarR family transcriptional regulator [Verrucomicrobia bacterium]|nr:MarR family transcriptional regulator [Verrucomicrobiota bacterium]
MKNEPGYDCVIQTLRTANALWRESRRFFRPFGITEAQFNVLHLLGQKPEGMRQRELSVLLVVDRSNVTLLLDRLDKRGWIRRHDVPRDRRAYRVCLTSSGEKLWGRVLPNYLEAVRQVVRGLSPSEIQTTRRVLQKIESRSNQRRTL